MRFVKFLIPLVLIGVLILGYTFRSKELVWNGQRYITESDVTDYLESVKNHSIKVTGIFDEYTILVGDILSTTSNEVYTDMQRILKDNMVASIFHRDITFNYNLGVNEDSLNNIINDIRAKENVEVVNSTYTYDNKKVYIKNGTDGSKISEEQLKNDILDAVQKSELNSLVNIKYVVEEFSKVNSSEIAAEVQKSPINADIVENDGVTQVVFAKEGSELSVDSQSTIDKNNSTPGYEFSVPITKIQPDRAEVDTSALFKSTLGKYQTSFASSAEGRATNVSRATELTNGVILNPGDEFSYSGTVGKPSLKRGFAYATVYENNKPVQGIGGGICQVSSTLYNAVLLADLEVTERRNHSLPVGYVPKGRDATIATGSIDFKFKNNYNFPIKIVASSAGRVCKISIMGKEVTKEVTLSVKSGGSNNGYSKYSLYKTVKENGVIIKDNVLESRSSYKNG